MARRFNPPPNWPAPPQGWTPPPGWQPDPSWGPPPPGWELWVKHRPNADAWKWSFLSGAGVYVLLLLIGTAVAGGPPSAEAAGAVLGRVLIATLLTWLVAALSSGRWPRWTYPLAVIGISLLVGAVSLAGQAGQTA